MANEILNSLLKEFEKKKLQAEISADKRKEANHYGIMRYYRTERNRFRSGGQIDLPQVYYVRLHCGRHDGNPQFSPGCGLSGYYTLFPGSRH